MAEKINRCKHCIHIYKHQYGKMKYCGAKKQRQTAYGNKKIKANDIACELFVLNELPF
jgi:hypothetical protein